jgi:DNA polymerase-3 subunit gamma/tau
MPLRFNKVSWDEIFQNLRKVAIAENLEFDESALRLAARLSKGSVRNSLQNLQTLMTYADGKKITTEIAQEALVAVDENKYFDIIEQILKPDAAEAMRIIENVLADGKDVNIVVNDLLNHIRNILVIKTAKDTAKLLFLTDDEKKKYLHQSQNVSIALCLQMIDILADVVKGIYLNINAQIMLEKFVICSIIYNKTENK